MRRRQRIYYSAARRSEIWDRWQAGEPMSSIGRRFDRNSSSVFSIISPSGGIRPPDRCRSKRALSLSEREEISRWLGMRRSLRSIARHLARSASTISREVQRNGGLDRYRAARSDQDAVLQGLVPAFDLALGLRVIRCSSNMPHALAVGIAWRQTGLALPVLVDHVVNPLADAAPALALIAVGATVARVPLPATYATPLAAVLLKLVVHPLLTWTIAHAWQLPADQTLIATITAALPPGINVYVLAAHFGRHAEDAARSFALATTLSAVSIAIVVRVFAWR